MLPGRHELVPVSSYISRTLSDIMPDTCGGFLSRNDMCCQVSALHF